MSIDPNQTSSYKGIGLLNVRRAGFDGAHTFIEAPSHLALPELLAKDTRVDLAYVDGMHTFDYTLVDLFYLDKMCNVGGVVGFNDCGMRSVHRVIRFLRTHRKYHEVNVDLPKCYRARNVLYSVGRRLLRRPTQDRYFEKLEDWEPEWNFYASF